jgi:hypothetical protein
MVIGGEGDGWIGNKDEDEDEMEKRRIVSYDVYAYGHNGVWTDSHGAEDWNQRAREGEDAGIGMSRHKVRCPVRLVYYIATKEQQFTRLRTTTTTHPTSTPTSTSTTRMLQKKRTISYHQQHVKGRGGPRCTETSIQLYCLSRTTDPTPCSHHSGSHSRRALQASTTPYQHPDRPCRD